MTTTTNNPEIARTILAQLGRGTMAMLGAFDLLDTGKGLQFRIKGSRLATHIVIELDQGADLYDVKIYKLGRAPKYKITMVTDTTGVYVDSLHTVIERATGLLTRL